MSQSKQTPLHALHQELGAKMVPFAGYEMPVQYPAGIIAEHRHTRSQAGLFDVSHMGQVRITGAEAAQALETLVPTDVAGLGEYRQRYALFTDDQGGILDDLMISNAGAHLFLVVNAACKAEDIARLRTHIGDRCEVEEVEDRGLLALQGPESGAVLEALAPVTAEMVFMDVRSVTIAGIDCFVARSGYTGEDGFEISVPAAQAESLARRLLDNPVVQCIGLGARDSLRLEAGLCLYGNDIDTSTTPVEADLKWSIPKVRRTGGARAGGFPGAPVILQQFAEGAPRRRVGIRPAGRAPVREGAELVDDANQPVGRVTSGGFGPSVDGPVAMGYVAIESAVAGTPLQAIVRGKPHPVSVVGLPFVEHRYYRG